MYAIKNAILIKERYPETDITICYQDIRAYGKGYEEYYKRAESMGIRFLRGLPGSVDEGVERLSLQVENTETDEVLTLYPDLIVLSVGLDPAPDIEKLAKALGIPLEETGFMRPLDDTLGPVLTIRKGIYVAGTVTAPRDIPDSVTMGEAAAMKAVKDVREAETNELWNDTLWWDRATNTLCFLNQALLPERVEVVKCGSVQHLIKAIARLEIRGAPALGVAGGYGVVLAAINCHDDELKKI
jgi:heterodisulfide reductase subunit A-like polyferredoxin